MLDGSLFALKYLPPNEEVDGTRNRPSPNISISIHHPIKLGALFFYPKKSDSPVKIFLPVAACYCLFLPHRPAAIKGPGHR